MKNPIPNEKVVLDVKKKNKKLAIKGLGLAILNSLIFGLIFRTNGPGFYDNFKQGTIATLIAFPILAFLLGPVFALIPYKQLSYNNKYTRASLLSLFYYTIYNVRLHNT